MRTWLVAMAFAVPSASADPPKAPPIPAPVPVPVPTPVPVPAKPSVKPVEPIVISPGIRTLTPSIGGGYSAGIVLEPKDHPDMQPWPRGMVIKPPDVDPKMLLDLDFGLDDPASKASRLFGTILNLLVPPTL
jgi:hypothetical protein